MSDSPSPLGTPAPAPEFHCSSCRCPLITASDRQGGGRALTPERKAVFLRTLSETGSVNAASEAATPWSTAKGAGESTFRDERARDPDFASQWDAALASAVGEGEAELRRRAFDPPKRPIWSKGECVGYVEDRNSSDKLLLAYLARHDPEWSQRSKLTVDGEVSHDHKHAHTLDVRAMAGIYPEDVRFLSPERQALFIECLGEIVAARGAEERALPARASDSAPKQLAAGTERA